VARLKPAPRPIWHRHPAGVDVAEGVELVVTLTDAGKKCDRLHHYCYALPKPLQLRDKHRRVIGIIDPRTGKTYDAHRRPTGNIERH
jgi:hypothetical protein